MRREDPRLVVQPAPFLRARPTTPGAMRDVVYALIPIVLGATWWFGLSALLVLLAASAGALLTEWAFSAAPRRGERLRDLSALATGLLLGLALPPGLPLWMAFIGGAVGIGLGKLIWGGLGQNLFNPALVGRAFLLAAFPTAMTTWKAPGEPGRFFAVASSNLALPLTQPMVDGLTAATPLGLMKFSGQETPLAKLLLGNTAGCFGETSGLLILLGGLFLMLRRSLDWRITISIVLSTAVFSGLLHLVQARYPDPLVSVFSGGLLFGAVFMATDPVTSPVTPKGAWIYGTGIGLLTMLIRTFGGFPEGVMYAILLMNAATPWIEHYTQPRPFGRRWPSG